MSKQRKANRLTPQELSKIYYDLNKQYYGEGMVIDKDIEMEWARIPHFYTQLLRVQIRDGLLGGNKLREANSRRRRSRQLIVILAS